MCADHSIQAAVRDGRQPVNIKVNIEIGLWTVRHSGKFWPILVTPPFYRTISVTNPSNRPDRKRFLTWANLKYIAGQGSPDSFSRIISHKR
jgi:hypothetical protein